MTKINECKGHFTSRLFLRESWQNLFKSVISRWFDTCARRASVPRESQTAVMNVIRTLRFQFLIVVIFKLQKTLIIHLNGSVFSFFYLKPTWNVKNESFFMILVTDHEHRRRFLLLDFSLKLFWKFYHDFVYLCYVQIYYKYTINI